MMPPIGEHPCQGGRFDPWAPDENGLDRLTRLLMWIAGSWALLRVDYDPDIGIISSLWLRDSAACNGGMTPTDLQTFPERQSPYRKSPSIMKTSRATSLHLEPEPEKSPEDLLNNRELAIWFGVDISWVKNHCTRTEPILPFIQLGGGRYATRRFRRCDIEEFLALHTVRPSKTRKTA